MPVTLASFESLATSLARHPGAPDDQASLLASLIESMPCGVSVFDADLRLVASNRRLQDMLHLHPDSYHGERTFPALMGELARQGTYGPGQHRELIAEREAQMRKGGPFEVELVLADGTTLQVRGAPMPDGAIITTYTDITAERRATEALRGSEQRLKAAVRAAGLALWEYDARRKDITLYGSWTALIGLSPDTQRLTLEALDRFVPEHALRQLSAGRIALVKGDTDLLSEEHQVVTADGRVIWVHTQAQVTQRDPDGQALTLMGACRDVTQAHEAAAAMQDALQAADAANRAKSDFLATMSHEIRTPINGVIGLTQLLSQSALQQRERSYVEMIEGCAKSLLALVDDVLDVSKIEAGRMTVEEETTDLHALLEEQGRLFATRASDKGLSFDKHVDAEVPRWIRTDPARLRQILQNLLGNAWKFTEKGGIALDASVDDAQGTLWLELAVSDSGVGISEADQQRLFTRFTQADSSTTRRHHGTGLGLAISRQLAQLLGGDVRLISRPGVGSVFTLRAPLHAVQAPAVAPAPPPPPPVSAPTCGRILLVEDNDMNRIVARGLLEALGYLRVEVATNGVEAVDLCGRQRFDLILMDCQMPRMDGLAATRELRARGVRTPIVALTANAVSGDRERCLAAGMDDYLAKPIEMELLGQMLRRWLPRGAHAADAAAPTGADGLPRVPPTASAPRAPEPSAFDAPAVHERFMGNHDLFVQARTMFLERTPGLLHELAGCLSMGDVPAARKLAHGIRGSAATMGANLLADRCGRIEADPGAAAAPGWLREAQAALARFVALSE